MEFRKQRVKEHLLNNNFKIKKYEKDPVIHFIGNGFYRMPQLPG
jgi:hypothetical protein